jgi:leucyl aminopeptidase
MKIRLLSPGTSSSGVDLCIGLAFSGPVPDLGKALVPDVKAARATGDLNREFRKFSLFRPSSAGSPKRLGFVGMGKRGEVDAERLRRGAAVAQNRAELLGVDRFRILLGEADHKGVDPDIAARAIAEGMVLGAYRYAPPRRREPKIRRGQTGEVVYLGGQRKAFAAGFKLGEIGARATVFTRDVENLPGNICTPTYMAQQARKLAGKGIAVKVLEERDMERLKMGALLGVSRGSDQPAKLILMDYKPTGYKRTLCAVGKGLTFDSGGISIKPSPKMDEMRYDMCGGGAVLGLFHALRNGGLDASRDKPRVVGIIVASENLPGARAQKPGDVVTAMDGTTIEVLNTDAEGRLILADGLAYAIKTYKPDQLVDLATLTGAAIVALGHEVAAVMGTDDQLIEDLIEAADRTDEPLWELPLWEVHREQMKGRNADVANINSPGQGNGSIAGGAFLSYFTEGTAWAHIDIAGTAWGGINKDYYRTGATGAGVRTLLQWVHGTS